MLATAIAPPFNITLAPTPSLDDDIQRAAELWEQANNLLLDAGRIFAEAKAGAKRKFNQLIESANLEKTQVGKLVRAIEAADEIPSSVAARLGLPMLVQLGQPRSEPVIDAIVTGDTQASVAQKIKELKKPATPKEVKPIRYIGGQKGGVSKLRIELLGGPEVVELERNWRESGLPPVQWVQGRTANTQNISSSEFQSLKDEIKKVKSVLADIDITQPNSGEQIEKVLEQLNFLLKEESGSATVTLPSLAVSTADEEQVVSSQVEPLSVSAKESEGLEVHEVSLESSRIPVALTDEPGILSKDEQTAVQAHLNGDLEKQAVAITTPRTVLEKRASASFVDTERTSQDEPAEKEVNGMSQQQLTEEADELLLTPPILPTERYKQGWKPGDLAIANVTYGVFPMSFRLWCEGQPVRIESVAGDIGSEQRLEVTRHDGASKSIPSTWIEEVTEPPLTLSFQQVSGSIQASEFNWSDGQTDTRKNDSTEFVSDSTRYKVVNVEHKLELQKTDFEVPDNAELSESMKKAQNWETITELVNTDASILTNAVNNWSPDQKEILINHVVTYLEKNKRAIFCRELDWMPIQFLKEVFFKLSFKVHDICEGLAAPWHDSCKFVDVTNFGNDDDEAWKFVNASETQIKVWSRDDFEVLAF